MSRAHMCRSGERGEAPEAETWPGGGRMGGKSNAFGAVPLTRDKQSVFFSPRVFFFITSLCLRERASWSLPWLPFER